MKYSLLICAAVAAVLDGMLLLPSAHEHATLLEAVALVLMLVLLVALLAVLNGSPKKSPGTANLPIGPSPGTANLPIGPSPGTANLPIGTSPVPPPVPAANQAEAEIVAFLALLQEKGRLVDFLMDDVASYDDAQVGAAARVVHQGCREILREYFKITPVSAAAEGSPVTVPAGYSPDEYRLLGKIAGEPPFTGTLIHKGWKTEYVKLPRIIKTGDRLPGIAPAEVELR